jgi:hypothetical protein
MSTRISCEAWSTSASRFATRIRFTIGSSPTNSQRLPFPIHIQYCRGPTSVLSEHEHHIGQ